MDGGLIPHVRDWDTACRGLRLQRPVGDGPRLMQDRGEAAIASRVRPVAGSSGTRAATTRWKVTHTPCMRFHARWIASVRQCAGADRPATTRLRAGRRARNGQHRRACRRSIQPTVRLERRCAETGCHHVLRTEMCALTGVVSERPFGRLSMEVVAAHGRIRTPITLQQFSIGKESMTIEPRRSGLL